MPIRVNSSGTYDALIHLIDTVNSEPDPLGRLALYVYLTKEFRLRVLRERDRAAYEARLRYATYDIADTLVVDSKQILNWAGQHQRRVGAPKLGKRWRQDLSDVIDVSDFRTPPGSKRGLPEAE